MFEASIAPSAAPAPTIVCSSSMKRMTLRARLISSITALIRSSNWPRYLVPRHHEREVERDDLLLVEDLRDVAGGDLLGQALDDRRLADARLADQDRVVLRAPAEDLDHAADLGLAADDRVHLALAGELGQVPAERLQGRGLDLLLLVGLPAGPLGGAGRGLLAAALGSRPRTGGRARAGSRSACARCRRRAT